MAVSLGPFMTCFLAVLFLTVYIYIVIYVKKDILYSGMKLVFVGIALILIRMLVPFNFPFTQTIVSYKIMPFISKFVFRYIGNGEIQIDFAVVLFGVWVIVSVLKMLRLLWVQMRYRACLRPFAIKDKSKYPELFQVLNQCGASFHEVCIIPNQISPAVFGVMKPILILPNCKLSERELYYICLHEAEHCRNHDLWLRLFLDLVICTQWFNPLVYFLNHELTLAFELSNDRVILKSMDEIQRAEYAECVMKMVRYQNNKKMARGGVISFAQVNRSNVKTRVRYILAREDKGKNGISIFLNYAVVGFVLVASFIFVPEAYRSEGLESEYSIGISDYNNAYFLKRDDIYWLYADGELVMGVRDIPNELVGMLVVEEEIESEKEK